MLKKSVSNPKFSLLIYSLIHRNLIRSKIVKKINEAWSARAQRFAELAYGEKGDVPGWVLVVLMTTGLVTGIWTVAQPRLSSILRNSLDNMNSIR
jgi:hypothetical protein